MAYVSAAYEPIAVSTVNYIWIMTFDDYSNIMLLV